MQTVQAHLQQAVVVVGQVLLVETVTQQAVTVVTAAREQQTP
jgi:hypothetical protein